MVCVPCGVNVATAESISGLLDAGSKCKTLAEETSAICEKTQQKGKNVMNLADNVKKALGGMGTINPAAYKSILDLLDGDGSEQIMNQVDQMRGMADECVSKSNEMATTMKQGADSLPQWMKDEAADPKEDSDGADDDTVATEFENDITDIEDCSRALQQMNLLSAATEGKSAFEGLTSKKEAFQSLFNKVKQLCKSVGRISQGFLFEGNCCAQIKKSVQAVREMLRCVKLSEMVQKLAVLGRRMVAAVVDLVKVAWKKFRSFTGEYSAASTMKNWFNKIPGSKIMSPGTPSATSRDIPLQPRTTTASSKNKGLPLGGTEAPGERMFSFPELCY
eukprot:CAMPEP_0194029178 /NCGR_PEP_ID=MMETSP0009_2-20130614/2992_1 /TAXON_ID=210454 /ORGANISM="Grammatophora oceanica, Strain CCMP 410" /LENGTH=333 /DNA_ID=CAMNT_0038668783 /DNA_START=95 /DNA_END=1096 /DNA_ORIENTATION=-